MTDNTKSAARQYIEMADKLLAESDQLGVAKDHRERELSVQLARLEAERAQCAALLAIAEGLELTISRAKVFEDELRKAGIFPLTKRPRR